LLDEFLQSEAKDPGSSLPVAERNKATAEILRFAQDDRGWSFTQRSVFHAFDAPVHASAQKGGLKWTFHEKTS